MPNVKPEVAEQLLKEIPTLIEKYPVEGENEDSLKKEGVTYIDDIKVFRKTLTKSEDPKPLVEWGDLPTSKF